MKLLIVCLLFNLACALADDGKLIDDRFHAYIGSSDFKKMAKYIKKHGANIYNSHGEHALLTAIKFSVVNETETVSLLLQGGADLHLLDIGAGNNVLVQDFSARVSYDFTPYSTSKPIILEALLSDSKTILTEIEVPFNHCSALESVPPWCLLFVNHLLAHQNAGHFLYNDLFLEKIIKIIKQKEDSALEFFGQGEFGKMPIVPVMERALGNFKYILAIFQGLYPPDMPTDGLVALVLKQNEQGQNFCHLYGKQRFHQEKSKMFVSFARLFPKESLPKLLNTRDREGRTMLHYVQAANDPDLVDYVKLGGDPLTKDKNGVSVLDSMIALGAWSKIINIAKYMDDFPIHNFQQLALHRPQELVDFQLRNGRNAAHMLIIAKMTEHLPGIEDFEKLLVKRDIFGNSPFHYLAMYGDAQDFDLINKMKGKLTSEHLGPNQSGNSCLHVAVRNNNLPAIELFLALGDGASEKNPILDMTPLYMAVKLGHFEAALKILAYIPKDALIYDSSDDVNIIHLVIEEHKLDLLRALLVHSPTLFQIPNLKGQNVFQILVHKGEFKALLEILDIVNPLSAAHIGQLMDRGLDPGNDYGTGTTLLHKLIQVDRHEFFPKNKLNKKLADLRDLKGQTVLHLAVLKQNATLITELLDCHADPNILDGDGFSPAHYFAFKTPDLYSNKKGLYRHFIAAQLDPNLKSAQGFTFYGHVILDGEFVETFLDDIHDKVDPFLTDNDGNNLLAQLVLNLGIVGAKSEDNLLLEETLIRYAEKIYQLIKDRNGEKSLTLKENKRGDNALDLARRKYLGVSNKLVSFLFNHVL